MEWAGVEERLRRKFKDHTGSSRSIHRILRLCGIMEVRCLRSELLYHLRLAYLHVIRASRVDE